LGADIFWYIIDANHAKIIMTVVVMMTMIMIIVMMMIMIITIIMMIMVVGMIVNDDGDYDVYDVDDDKR